jgi:hypothetical protein
LLLIFFSNNPFFFLWWFIVYDVICWWLVKVHSLFLESFHCVFGYCGIPTASVHLFEIGDAFCWMWNWIYCFGYCSYPLQWLHMSCLILVQEGLVGSCT